MNGKALLDTNAVIGLLNQDSRAVAVISGLDAFLPSIVVGELYYGAFKSSRPQENLEKLARFLPFATELVCDHATAYHYGQIKSRLRAVGLPIPENDLWIAATARQHGLELLSRDTHFDAVAGLTRIAW